MLDDSFCLRETDLPVSNSKWLEVLRIRVTAVTRQYQPNGHDGHFVMFQHPEARRQTLHLLGTAARDGVPVLPKQRSDTGPSPRTDLCARRDRAPGA